MSRRASYTGLPCTGVFCKTKCSVPRLFRLGKGSLEGVPLFETGNECRNEGGRTKRGMRSGTALPLYINLHNPCHYRFFQQQRKIGNIIICFN